MTSAPPSASPAQQQGGEGAPLRYLGRDACSPSTPCEECAGDCDDDSDCYLGLMRLERERGDASVRTTVTIHRPTTIPTAVTVATAAMEARLFPRRRHRRCDGSGPRDAPLPGLAGHARGIATRTRTAWTGTRASRGWWGICRWSRDAGWAGRGTSPAVITAITPARRRRKIRPRRRRIPQRLAAVEAVEAAVVAAAP